MNERIFSGKYQIQREIARGGMGTIFHAIDLTLRREVAIKVLHAHYSGDPSFAQRFLGEARGMARLDHPNIVRVYAVEEEGEIHYIVMEFFPGQDLKHILREGGPLPLPKALHYAIEITKALTYAHQKNLIHRDIKPGNVLVDEQDHVKITDFGIAAALDESSATLTGTIMGTPEYMSPEQAKGERVDAGSDLFSLGIVFYEMLTEKTPYEGLAGASIVGKLAYEQAEIELNFPSSVPQSLQYLIRGLTKKASGERLNDATLVLETLKDHQLKLGSLATTDLGGDSTSVVPPPSREPPTPTGKIPSAPEYKTETPSPPHPVGSDPPPSKITDQFRRRSYPIRALAFWLTGSLFLVGVIVLILNILPPPGEKKEDEVALPPVEAQEKPQQGKAVIQALAHLLREYTNEDTRQQETTQALVADIDTLQAQIKKIRSQSAQESNRQEIERASKRLVNLDQEVEQEKARQQEIRQILSQKTQETLKQADTTILGEIDITQRDQIQTGRAEVITAQKQLKDQQSSFKKKIGAKVATVTAALAETKGAIEAAKRRETQARSQAEAQQEKEVADRQTQVTTAISNLDRLNHELEEARAQHEGARQTLLGEADTLLATILGMTPSRDPENSQHQLEAAEQRLVDLRQQIRDEQIRQQASAQTRTARVAVVLTEASQVSQGKLKSAQRRDLQEISAAIKSAQQQLDEQQMSFKQELEAKVTTVTNALAEAKGVIEEVKRRETEAQAQQEKEEADQQAQVTASISNLDRLNHELEEARAQHQAKRQTLLGEADMLLATIQDMTPLMDSARNELQIEAAEQGITDLRHQIRDEQTRQQASAQTRSARVAAALTEAARLSEGRLEAAQRRDLQEIPAAIKAAHQQLEEQQASFKQESDKKVTGLKAALDQKKEALADVKGQQEEAEAERLAALEEGKRKEEVERQRREKEQQRVALQIKDLEEKLDHFRSAYENHDLSTLQQTTSMDGRRINQVKFMFKAYPTIEIVTEIQAITEDGASAIMVITKLIDQEGKTIHPSPILRETKIKIPKEGDAWGKIQW